MFIQAHDVSLIQYIRCEMPRKFGLRTGGRDKYEAIDSDLDNLVQSLWRTEECYFKNERMRVQSTFYLQMHAYSGTRTSTFIEGTFYKGSGKCLKYEVSKSRKQIHLWLRE